MNLKFEIAKAIASTSRFGLSLAGRRATSLPGSLALRVMPDLLSEIRRHVKGPLILVAGTNGKTTTTRIVADLLAQDGYAVVSNTWGANLAQGLATALLKGWSDLKSDRGAAVLEVDEATLPRVFPALQPDAVLLTNFFRDQMDRYAELDKVVGNIRQSVAKRSPRTKLVLNADDPLVRSISDPADGVVFFGLDRTAALSPDACDPEAVRDGRFCVRCGERLHYDGFFFGQFGLYSCPGCGFSRPEPDVKGLNLQSLEDGFTFEVGGEKASIRGRALYNVYNALAAAAVGQAVGISQAAIGRAIADVRPDLGRLETFHLADGRSLTLILIKNPTGCNEAIKAVERDIQEKDLLIILNDGDPDGTDVSWIWDVDMERIPQLPGLRHLFAAGHRPYDMAVRLKYAGAENITVIEEPKRVIDRVHQDSTAKQVYVLSTYTSLYDVRDYLLSLGYRSDTGRNSTT